MGQYYKAISLDAQTYLCAHDHTGDQDGGGFNGIKLMEHSYIGNPLTAAVENLIKEGGAWYGHRIVWAGDYADPEPNTSNGEEENEHNLYFLIEKKLILPAKNQKHNSKLRYLINLDKKEFVDINKISEIEDWAGTKIHPLPLLTCEGNGQGGGDFHNEKDPYYDMIGSWARDRVTISTEKPKDKGMTEIKFDPKETI